uniref:hypothetical protein n=1 Tax=Parerythrobacter lutipelagi TaxID=1964208 RepID=UPI0010F5AA35|nr:hypothetical protein [Parerythrobacter lutipelagi]
MVKGILGTIGVHLVLALALFGLLYMFTDSFSDASESLLINTQNSDDASRIVLDALESARSDLFGWAWQTLLVSCIAAILFLFSAHRTMPQTPKDKSSRLWLWTLLFVVILVAMGFAWWRTISIPAIADPIDPGSYAITIATLVGLTILGFWLCTALFVKATMVKSVPLGFVLRQGG